MFYRGHCIPPFYYQDTFKLGSLFVKDTKACNSLSSIIVNHTNISFSNYFSWTFLNFFFKYTKGESQAYNLTLVCYVHHEPCNR